MVEVGDVGVPVGQRFVLVGMGVPPGDGRFVGMGVVGVVLVGVGQPFVFVGVFVGAPTDEGHACCRGAERDELTGRDGIGKIGRAHV